MRELLPFLHFKLPIPESISFSTYGDIAIEVPEEAFKAAGATDGGKIATDNEHNNITVTKRINGELETVVFKYGLNKGNQPEIQFMINTVKKVLGLDWKKKTK